MVKVMITQGMALEIVLARILRENGLHVVKVHNGVITHHGKLERVKEEEWMKEAIEEDKEPKGRKRSGKATEPASSET